MQNKLIDIIQIILFIIAAYFIINLIGETESEQAASGDAAYFRVYKKMIKEGFLSILLFISIIYLEIRSHRINKKVS